MVLRIEGTPEEINDHILLIVDERAESIKLRLRMGELDDRYDALKSEHFQLQQKLTLAKAEIATEKDSYSKLAMEAHRLRQFANAPKEPIIIRGMVGAAPHPAYNMSQTMLISTLREVMEHSKQDKSGGLQSRTRLAKALRDLTGLELGATKDLIMSIYPNGGFVDHKTTTPIGTTPGNLPQAGVQRVRIGDYGTPPVPVGSPKEEIPDLPKLSKLQPALALVEPFVGIGDMAEPNPDQEIQQVMEFARGKTQPPPPIERVPTILPPPFTELEFADEKESRRSAALALPPPPVVGAIEVVHNDDGTTTIKRLPVIPMPEIPLQSSGDQYPWIRPLPPMEASGLPSKTETSGWKYNPVGSD